MARVERRRPWGHRGCLTLRRERTGRKHTCAPFADPATVRRSPAGGIDTMRRTPTLIRVLLSAAGAAPIAPHAPTAPPMLFPVVGGASYIDDYGAPRPQGSHQGNDLMAAKRTPVIAVASGIVKLQHSGRGGYMLYLRNAKHEWLYIHLNNDIRGNDGKG